MSIAVIRMIRSPLNPSVSKLKEKMPESKSSASSEIVELMTSYERPVIRSKPKSPGPFETVPVTSTWLAYIDCGEGEVTVVDVEEALRQNPEKPTSASSQHPEIFNLPLRQAREQFEREYLSFKLREVGGSVGKLAEAVGMERTHLYRKLRSLGVDPKTATTGGAGK